MRTKLSIVSPHGQAAGRDIKNEAAPGVEVALISGGHNFIGNSGSIHVQIHAAPRARQRVVIHPGPEHVTEEQKVQIKTLCEEWVALHAALKKAPLTHRTAWTKINAVGGATSYHLIRADRFDTVVTFIRRQMVMLSAMKSAPAKDPGWRSKRITAIKARCKNQLGSLDAYKSYILKNFKAESLSDLATDELQKTYAYIMAKKAE